MAQKVKLNQLKYTKVLEAINQYPTLKKAADALEKKYHTVRKKAILLEKLGLLHSVRIGNRRLWAITAAGKDYLVQQASMGVEKVKLWRLHANAYSFDILEKPANWDRQKPALLMKQGTEIRQARLNNNTVEFIHFFDVTAKVCNNKIIIYINKIYAATPEEADIKAMEKLMKVFPKIDRHLRKMNIVIKKPNYGVSCTNTQHYARENDEIAIAVSEMGKSVDARDEAGELRVSSDKSNGYPELEFPSPSSSLEDSMKYNKFLAALVTSRVDPIQNKKQIEHLTECVVNLQKLAVKEITLNTNTVERGGIWN